MLESVRVTIESGSQKNSFELDGEFQSSIMKGKMGKSVIRLLCPCYCIGSYKLALLSRKTVYSLPCMVAW